MRKLQLECPHSPKDFRMTFSCSSTGNYVLEVCKKCHEIESKDHLINEEVLN